MPETHSPRLFPAQVCFVVDDVSSAARDCTERFGWGPFQHFTARVPDASYRDWTGSKVTDVGLGMAGAVQVELIHVHEGQDCIAAYQAEYGTGFQHLGIACRSRDNSLRYLEGLGGALNELNEYEGIRIAFVDTPTGPAMFELLERTASAAVPDATRTSSPEATAEPFALDRATIVTSDMKEALRFYSTAFGWKDAKARSQTLCYENRETRVERFVGRAGTLQLELLAPTERGEDPYSAHLARGDHGLVHAGGAMEGNDLPRDGSLECEWKEEGEAFGLYDWFGGKRALQIRRSSAGAPG